MVAPSKRKDYHLTNLEAYKLFKEYIAAHTGKKHHCSATGFLWAELQSGICPKSPKCRFR